MRKLKPESFSLDGKVPPQAVDLERQIIGQCIAFESNRQYVPFLKPEHFYRDAHQTIWKAIGQLQTVNLQSVSQKLREMGELDSIGGPYYLTQLAGAGINPAAMEYAGRIIQQMFINREVIRISGDAIQQAYDSSVDPIGLFDKYFHQMEQVETLFENVQRHGKISTLEDEQEYLEAARNGTIQMGLSTGFTRFDEYFKFKPGSLVICNGHDNVGKTAILVYLAVVANRLHGWKWILACMENREAQIRKETIQFVSGKPISRLTDEEYQKWLKWSLANFTILKINDNITAPRLLKTAQRIIQTVPHQAFLIDPYNALDLEKGTDKFFNSHEYHYQVTSQMRLFIKKTGCSIYLNTHAVTEALRTKHKDGDYQGFPMPPEKADTEGGGKFSNRADDFITFHRYTQHPTDFNVTHIHVRKIKDTQTGGKPTPKDEPVKLKMLKGYMGFFDEDGSSPIVNTHLPKINPNTPDYHDDQPF